MSYSSAIKGLDSYLKSSSFREFAISRSFAEELVEGYQALKAECESNAKSAQYSAETNRKISRKNGEMHDEILSLKAERDAMAVEVESIREKSGDVYSAGYNHGHLNTADGIAYAPGTEDEFYHRALEVMVEVQTPATDDFLNSVRSDAIDDAINEMANSGAQTFGECVVAVNQLRAGKDGE